MHLSSSFAEGRFAGLFLALLLACATLYGPQTRAQQASDQAGEPANEAASEVGRAEVSVFLFKGGAPEPGLALYQGDTLLGRSDSEGAVFARIRAGQSVLEVRRDGQTIYEHSVNAAADDYIQLIITLDSGAPVANVEGEGGEELVVDSSDAEPGRLRGVLRSVVDGSPVAGVKVFASGLGELTRTDAEGAFSAEVPAGAYVVSLVHPNYTTRTLPNVEVAAEQETLASAELTPAGLELEEFVVTAPFIEGSVASVLAEQRASSEVAEVIGAEQFSKAGDSDAAEALQRVSGLVIEDGKFVVVRGQPSRYTATTFNGASLPSPDPVQQIVPLDLFPANVLRSIAVQKSFSADKPGGFGGGLIELRSRAIPESTFFEIGVKVGGNTESTGKDGLESRGGSRDWLGEDDGTRALPPELAAAVSTPEALQTFRRLPEAERNALGRTLDPNYALDEQSLPPNAGVSLSGGTSRSLFGGQAGVLGSLDLSNGYKRSVEIERSFNLAGGGRLDPVTDFVEERTDFSSTLGSLLVFGWENEFHRVNSNSFFIRDTIDRTQVDVGTDRTSDDREERNFLIEFNQRELFVQQLQGEHSFNRVLIDWGYQSSTGERERPDRRQYRYQLLSNDRVVNQSEFGLQREYNTTTDDTQSLSLNGTLTAWDSERLDVLVKLGAASSEQDRRSQTLRFRLQPDNDADLFDTDPESFYAPENIGAGLEFESPTLGNDNYAGRVEIDGYFLQTDVSWADRLRVVSGVRFEDASYETRTFSDEDTTQAIVSGFETSDALPAVSLTYFLNDTMQIRAAFGDSISRPLLVETSATSFFDPDNGRQFVGNTDLVPTEIRSYDLRYEWYPSGTQSLTAGVFYKDYTNAIERSFIPIGGGRPVISFINAPTASVSGVELGGRLDLRSVALLRKAGEWIEQTYLQANLSVIDSEVELDADTIATNARRQLQGQADNALNLQLGFEGEQRDWVLSYNRVGKRLDTAGIFGLPDIFEDPIAILDAAYTQRFGRAKVKLTIGNVLDAERTYKQGDQLQRQITTGTSYGLSFGYAF